MLVLTATKHRIGIIYQATWHMHIQYYLECSVCMLLHCRNIADGRWHFCALIFISLLSNLSTVYRKYHKIVLTRWQKFAAFNCSPPQTQLGAHSSISDSLTSGPLQWQTEERSRKEDGYMGNPFLTQNDISGTQRAANTNFHITNEKL